MSNEQRLEIDVCGISCILMTKDKNRLDTVINLTETRMRELLAASPKTSIAAAALMTALEYCDSALHEQESAQNMREQIREYIVEGQHARTKCEKLQEENQMLRSRILANE